MHIRPPQLIYSNTTGTNISGPPLLFHVPGSTNTGRSRRNLHGVQNFS